MFNLNKSIKSFFNKVLVKKAAYEQLLEKERKDQGLGADETPEIFESKVNSKEKDALNEISEGRMVRKESDIIDTIVERRMDDELKYSLRKNDEVRDEVPRMSVASEKWDSEYRNAFEKAQKSLEKQADIFEKYIGKKPKKVPSNVPESASGIPNRPERFVGFDGVPGVDVKENLKNIDKSSKVKPMHTIANIDSIKKLDAAAFYITYKAASADRDLNDEENILIKKIIDKKRSILLQS